MSRSPERSRETLSYLKKSKKTINVGIGAPYLAYINIFSYFCTLKSQLRI